MKRKLFLFVCVLGLGSFLTACSNKTGTEESTEAKTKVIETEMGEVEVQS